MKSLAAAKYVARNHYAWPGGYPLYLALVDGAALCPACVRSEFKQIARSAITCADDGWRPMCADVNYEDPLLFCAHCNERIESAYAED